MATAVNEVHAFDLAKKAGREPYKVKDLTLAEFGRNEIRLAGHLVLGEADLIAAELGEREIFHFVGFASGLLREIERVDFIYCGSHRCSFTKSYVLRLSCACDKQ